MRQTTIGNTTVNLNGIQVITISDVSTGKWKVICNDGIEFETTDSTFITNIKSDIDKANSAGFELIVLKSGQYDPTTGEPTISDPKTTAIYLTPKTSGSGKNIYTEWIYADSKWEKLGDTTIDLSDYYKKSETYSKTEVDAAITNYHDSTKADDSVVVKTVNSVAPTNGNVNVVTFTEVPDSYGGHEIRKSGTIEEFCQDVEAYINPPAGSGYLAMLSCSDLPHGIGNAELLMYVPAEGIYVLELSTCGAFDDNGNSGKFIAIYWGTMYMTWQGFMTCPQDSGRNYVPTKNSDGVSLYYLKKFAEKNNLQMPD